MRSIITKLKNGTMGLFKESLNIGKLKATEFLNLEDNSVRIVGNRTGSTATANGSYGASISVSGKDIAIGASYTDTEGAVFVYDRLGTSEKILTPAVREAGAQFGCSVSSTENHTAVGAWVRN